ncbi:MAG: hypothetical protein JRE38_01770 [Deltaproteobacteria bacterium]|nr:hypothetical protein [Deltaproteobacteria bacterium]MBW2576776.1 hypothetical protein [Deltaproteobacteria bacterium]MBW2694064.1 hypothetical protein [Deltaproteobacteria bacterium]
MDPNEALLTIAEIAIATIGFAGIMSALRPSSSHSVDAMHRLRLRLMVEASASVMIFAFLPFVLQGLVDSESVWTFGSGILAVTSPLLVGSIYVRQRRLFGSGLIRETLLFDTFVMASAVVVEIALIVNCLGIFFESHFSAYLLGVLFPLAVAVAMFIRAIFAADAHDRGVTPSDSDD